MFKRKTASGRAGGGEGVRGMEAKRSTEAFYEVKEIILEFDGLVAHEAENLISAIKRHCKTYGEADDALSKIEQGLAWEGKTNYAPLLTAVKRLLEEEKGRLLMSADDPSS